MEDGVGEWRPFWKLSGNWTSVIVRREGPDTLILCLDCITLSEGDFGQASANLRCAVSKISAFNH